MNTIKIRQYTPPQLSVFDFNDQFIGFINHYEEFKSLQNDIFNNAITGYYATYGEHKIIFTEFGYVGIDNIIFLKSLYNIKHEY
jgi:hypothetical protein